MSPSVVLSGTSRALLGLARAGFCRTVHSFQRHLWKATRTCCTRARRSGFPSLVAAVTPTGEVRDRVLTAVTVIVGIIVGLTFLFGFGNVLALALRLGVPTSYCQYLWIKIF
jgi:hypothetical protein